MDIRKAVRFIEAAGFNGLSKEETERFVELGKDRLEQLRIESESEMGFIEGDDIKYKSFGRTYYGRLISREGSLWVRFVMRYERSGNFKVNTLRKFSLLIEKNSVEKILTEKFKDLISKRLEEQEESSRIAIEWSLYDR